MTYRDTANTLAQRVTNNLVGVVLYRPMPWAKLPARWDAQIFPQQRALVEWYEELAGSPALYYYIAAFDKTYGGGPVADAIAPPQPDDLGYGAYAIARRSGYDWRPGAFPRDYKERSGIAVGAERSETYHEPIWFPLAFIVALFGGAYVSTSRAIGKIKRGHGVRHSSGSP